MISDWKPLPPRTTATLAAVAVAGLVWAPYASIPVPEHRKALYLQAALLLALSLALVALGWWRWRAAPEDGPELSRPVVAALGLYAAATLLGTVVALARGNPFEYLTGQAVSLGLLPLAAVAGLLLARTLPLGRLALTLVAATAAAALVHLGHAAVVWSAGETVHRLYFPHQVSVFAPSLLALLLALALAGGAPSRRGTALAWAAVAILALYIVGTGTRGLWLVTPVGLLFYAALARRPWVVLAPALGLTVALLGAYAALRPAEPRVEIALAAEERSFELSRQEDEAPRRRALFDGLRTPEPGWYGLRAEIDGEGSGRARLILRWFDDEASNVERRFLATIDLDAGRHTISELVPKPPSASTARLNLRHDEGRGRWHVTSLRFERTAGELQGAVFDQLRFAGRRTAGLAGLGSAEVRLMESARLLDRLRGASPAALLLGHGLGATFEPESPAGPSYIHNYYLFLLFKLGLLGTLLVAAAWIAWTAAAVHLARRAPFPATRSLAAALAAALLAYGLWGVTSPELLNFRLTPVWGLLIGALGARCQDR